MIAHEDARLNRLSEPFDLMDILLILGTGTEIGTCF